MQQAAPKSQADSREPFRPAGFEPLYSHISLLQRAGAQLSTEENSLLVQAKDKQGKTFRALLSWHSHNRAGALQSQPGTKLQEDQDYPDSYVAVYQLGTGKQTPRQILGRVELIVWLNSKLGGRHV